MRHKVFELNFGEASLAAVQRDLRRFAGISLPPDGTIAGRAR
jgi:hypothetical protein